MTAPRHPEPANDDRQPYAWAGFFICAFLMLALLAALLLTRVDWALLLDVIAPTAAQARDLGWQTIVEGL